jgi:hypothetical protein
MKSASEIVAAMIVVYGKSAVENPLENETENVRKMANEFYREILKMKDIKGDYP